MRLQEVEEKLLSYCTIALFARSISPFSYASYLSGNRQGEGVGKSGRGQKNLWHPE